MGRLLKSVLLICSVLVLSAPIVFAEDITITTYYPSPYGSYNQLQTNSLGVGDNDGDGTLDSGDVPTTAGNVWIKGKVGIGTTRPTVPLHVVGPSTGAVRIVDGNQAQGRILTSDANGVGTWSGTWSAKKGVACSDYQCKVHCYVHGSGWGSYSSTYISGQQICLKYPDPFVVGAIYNLQIASQNGAYRCTCE